MEKWKSESYWIGFFDRKVQKSEIFRYFEGKSQKSERYFLNFQIKS